MNIFAPKYKTSKRSVCNVHLTLVNDIREKHSLITISVQTFIYCHKLLEIGVQNLKTILIYIMSRLQVSNINREIVLIQADWPVN